MFRYNIYRSITQMNLNTLNAFRHEVYGCFERAADALFNTVDALLTEPQAHSFPELSLSPFFERRWCSLYEAFEDGRIDQERLRRVFATYLVRTEEGDRLWLGIDATSIERPESSTSPDRTVVYKPNLPESSKPISYGWQFSTVVVLPEQPSSWTAVLDQQRIRPEQTSVQVAATQLRHLAPRLAGRPIVASDRWYSCAPFLLATEGLPFDKLLRLKRKRVLYRPAPAPTGKRGAPRKDGERFQCGEPSTYGQADGSWQREDATGHRVEVTWWTGLHLPKARHLEVTVIRVVRPDASGKKRDPRESWFLWEGSTPLSLPEVVLDYRRRFGQEHGYRFDKQALLWTQPRLRTPAQFERWSQVVAIVHNHLVLARSLVQAELRPWESRQRPASPQQVRRAMAKILAQVGTPARPAKPRGKSPGRPKGAWVRPAPRYAVIYKTKPKPKKRRNRA
jgi:DDE superfamily endonuclease